MKKIFLPLVLGLTLTAGAQTVTKKLQFTKGQKLEMVTKVNTLINMDMMGQSMDTKMDATITRHFDVEDVNPSGAVIEHKVKRMQFNMEAPMMGSQTFDSENEKDMQGPAGKQAEKNLKNKYRMTVDNNGRITAVKADDDNKNESAQPATEGDQMASAMEQMGMGFSLPKVGDSSDFFVLPDGNVTKGQTWKRTRPNETTTYTVSNITDTDIVVDFVEDGKMSRKQEANGMEININATSKTTGKMMLDRKTGLLKESTSTTASDGTMEVMGQTVPMKTTVNKTVSVKS